MRTLPILQPTTAVTIRQGQLEDAEELAQVELASWRAAYREMIPDRVLQTLQWSKLAARWMSHFLKVRTGRDRTWVLDLDGTIIGYAQTGRSRDQDAGARTAELYTIYLHPSAWGVGLGASFLDQVADDLRRRGYTRLNLWVLEDNHRARAFYRKNDFKRDGARQRIPYKTTRLRSLRYTRAL